MAFNKIDKTRIKWRMVPNQGLNDKHWWISIFASNTDAKL